MNRAVETVIGLVKQYGVGVLVGAICGLVVQNLVER